MAIDLAVWIPRQLELLAPKTGADVVVGPRLYVNTVDTVEQILAAGASLIQSYDLSALGGAVLDYSQVDAYVLEVLRVAVQATDASGKLQVWELNPGDGASSLPFMGTALPEGQMFAPINAHWHESWCLNPIPVFLPGQSPRMSLGLLNTDASAAHTYRRCIGYVARPVTGIDVVASKAFRALGTGPWRCVLDGQGWNG